MLVLNHSGLPRIAESAIIFHGFLDSLLSAENKEKEEKPRQDDAKNVHDEGKIKFHELLRVDSH